MGEDLNLPLIWSVGAAVGLPSLATVVHRRKTITIRQAFSQTIRPRNKQLGTLTTKFSSNLPQLPGQALPKLRKAAGAPVIRNPGARMSVLAEPAWARLGTTIRV